MYAAHVEGVCVDGGRPTDTVRLRDFSHASSSVNTPKGTEALNLMVKSVWTHSVYLNALTLPG